VPLRLDQLSCVIVVGWCAGDPYAPGRGKWHALAACTKPGEEGLMVLGRARTTPLKSKTSEWPAGLDGGVRLGSGKLVTPCWRMHCESRLAMPICCAVGCWLPGPPPGSSVPHADWAALNAGEDGSIPRPM